MFLPFVYSLMVPLSVLLTLVAILFFAGSQLYFVCMYMALLFIIIAVIRIISLR